MVRSTRGPEARIGTVPSGTWRVPTMLVVVAMALTVVPAIGCGSRARPSGEQRLFHEGRDALKRADYRESIRLLNGYLDRYPQGELASRACFLRAKAHVGQGDLEAARSTFEQTIQDYPESEEAHKAQYKLAWLAMLRGDESVALEGFKRLVEEPNGTLVPEATAMIVYLQGR